MFDLEEFRHSFEECVKNCNNIFDLYVNIYKKLLTFEGDIISLEDELESNEDLNQENKQIQKEVSLALENENFNNFLDDSSRQKLIDMMESKDSKNPCLIYIFTLYCKIDEIFGSRDELYSKMTAYQNNGQPVQKMQPLNTEYTIKEASVYFREASFIQRFFKETDDVYPRRSNKIGSDIKGYQENLLIADRIDGDIKVNIHNINYDRTISALNNEKNIINMAIIPFTKDDKYIDFKDEGTYFTVKGLISEEIYTERVIETLKAISEQDIQIVIFPEFVFSSKMLKLVREYLRSNKEKNKLGLIIFGTIWEDRINKCVILSGDGKKLGEQHKLNKFHKTPNFNNKSNNEGIVLDSKKREINIYDIKHFGRINTPICVDFVSNNYYDRLLQMNVNVCFNPTYTESLYAFETRARFIGEHNYGSVFLCNTCIPIEKKVSEDKSKKIDKDYKLFFGYIPVKGIGIKNEQYCKCNGSNCVKTSKKLCYYMLTINTLSCEINQFIL